MNEQQKIVQRAARRENTRWWIKLFLQPLVFLAVGLLLLFLLGVAQRRGFLTTDHDGTSFSPTSVSAQGGKYICPMMCVPPMDAPGRCPVCGMELVPASAGVMNDDPLAVHIEPATRRVANIQSVAARNVLAVRKVKAVGTLSYNESTQKTISAYVGGRLDKMHIDYTGMVVQQGDPLALIYSQELYSAQAELIESIRGRRDGGPRSRLLRSIDLVEAASEKLRLLGLSETQIAELKSRSKPAKHITIDSPISGTVTEKLADEGDYVREGQPLLKVADLSSVWLMLELFPDDAGMAKLGQQVTATVASYPGETFDGTVNFISPVVDPSTRTVAVRVLIENGDGRLKIGDYADATLQVPLGESDTGAPTAEVLTVPRDAVLYAGEISVVYVETVPGRFEIRPVTLGPALERDVVIRSGLDAGDLVAARGNFLIDSQMQLAGNPSLVDPRRLKATIAMVAKKQDHGESHAKPTAKEMDELHKLPESDLRAAIEQAVCPVTMYSLGSMGVPAKVDVDGQTVFICCEGCRERILATPEIYMAKLIKPSSDEESLGIDAPPMGEIMEISEPESSELPEMGEIMEISP